MKLLKRITTLILLLALATTMFAQKHKENRKEHNEKIQAMKVSYISEKINLTTIEAQQFWVIYNEYDAKMEISRKSMRKMHRQEKSIDEMVDAEIEKMIKNLNDTRQKELDTQKEYLDKFKSVLSINKIAKLYKAEHDFKRDLLKKLKNNQRKSQGKHSGPPPH